MNNLNAIQESRKETERDVYDKLYSQGKEFSDPTIREGLLAESENYFLERMKELVPGKRVLEIGCGRGKHSLLAAQWGAASVTGIDISQAGIEVARLAYENSGIESPVNFLVMDIEALEFADQSFDVVIDHESFSSIDFDKAIEELYRVLNPGGVLLGLECLGHNPIFNLNRYFKKLFGSRTTWAVSNILRIEHLDRCRNYFQLTSFRSFSLTSVISWPILKRIGATRFSSIFHKIDQLILSKNVFKKFAFKAVFKLSRNPYNQKTTGRLKFPSII